MCLIFSFGQQKEGDPISKKVSLYTKGNNIQYPMISHNGKEYKKECVYICVCIYIYVCITESLCYRELTHCNSTIINYFNYKNKMKCFI